MLKKVLALFFSIFSTLTWAGFELVALGVNAGVNDGNLTSYLIRRDDHPLYLALDAGSVLPGIKKALQKGHFSDVNDEIAAPLTPQGFIFRERINSYFISHVHLDHVTGLVINSPDDSKKTIYGSATSIETLRTYYFNWRVWPNYTDAGSGTRLGIYRLQTLRPARAYSLGRTRLTGEIFPLSHAKLLSSMLLISKENEVFAYFGDTGPDAVEQSKNLDHIWQKLAKIITQKQLKGIIIGVSHPNDVADSKLKGSMTPKWLLHELKKLENYCGKAGQPLQNLPVIISHIIPSLKANRDVRKLVAEQLEEGNDMGIKFILMEQGDRQLL